MKKSILFNGEEYSEYNFLEYLKNSDKYELYTNQNTEIKIPFKLGSFNKNMMLRPYFVNTTIDASIPNIKRTWKKLFLKEILNYIEILELGYKERLKFTEKDFCVNRYVNGIWLTRFPIFGYIAKAYDVNIIMDMKIGY
jgi:hypothetical protein